MTAKPSYVILGAGIAGYSASTTLRALGFDGRVTLIGDEPVAPYERPPLSKTYLLGKKPADELIFQTPEQYAQAEIELRLGRHATDVDLGLRRLTLDDGEPIRFDKLLIATGARPIRLSGPGFDLPGVLYLRTMEDARQLAERLAHPARVLVVGAGFVGCEVAAAARTLGHEVTLVDLLPEPMAGALGQLVGDIFAEIHRRHGVNLHMRSRVTELRGHERVEEAILESGERIPCDLVVVGVGVRPATKLFAETVLHSNHGIIVDEYLESAVPGVFAAGDVANWWDKRLGRRLRVEHFDNAGLQGTAAARAMLGNAEPYTPLPYFWSDQYDVNLQFVGYPGVWDEVVLRGDPAEPAVTLFYLTEGHVQSAVTINHPRDLRSAKRLCEARAVIDPAVLASPETDLRALSKQVRVPS